MAIEVGEYKMININDIEMGERARKTLGNLNELEENMKEVGLIGCLAVKQTDENKYLLLAGGRRYTVLKRHGVEIVPVRVYKHDLSELEIKLIEKSENFYRKSMEFWEMDALTLEIHNLRQSIHGVKASGPIAPGWSLNDTAKELGLDKMSASNSLKRARLMEQHPNIFKECKTASDADKLIKKVARVIEVRQVAEQIQQHKASTPVIELSKRFIIDDFFHGVKDLPNESIDFIEADPPYGIRLEEIKMSDTISQYAEGDYVDIDVKSYPNYLKEVCTECYRVLRPNSWMLFWFAPDPWFETVASTIESVGFKVSRMAGIWPKSNGQTHQPTVSLANAYEMFFVARKGNPTLVRPGHLNIFNADPVSPNQKVHPTEKPVKLMEEIYSTFVKPNTLMLIPFLGSGNGLIAAYKQGINAIGYERSKNFKDSFIIKVNNGIDNLK